MSSNEVLIKRTIRFFTIFYGIIAICFLVGAIFITATFGLDVDDVPYLILRNIEKYIIPLALMVFIYWISLRLRIRNIFFIPLIVIANIVPGIIILSLKGLDSGNELMDCLPWEVLLFGPIFIIQKIGRETLRKETVIGTRMSDNFKLAVIGIALLFLQVLSYQVANGISDWVHEKRISDRENKRVITVENVSDELIYTAQGNPIGIKISYDVNFLSYYLGDDAVDLQKLSFEFDPERFIVGQTRLCPHPALSSRIPSVPEQYYTITDALLTNKKTYHVIQYLVPCDLKTEKQTTPVINLKNSCYGYLSNVRDNQFKHMRAVSERKHFSAKIDTASPFRWLTPPIVETQAEYSIGNFFDTMSQESVRICTDLEPDLVYSYE